MDATFFAAAHVPRLGKFWWRENWLLRGRRGHRQICSCSCSTACSRSATRSPTPNRGCSPSASRRGRAILFEGAPSRPGELVAESNTTRQFVLEFAPDLGGDDRAVARPLRAVPCVSGRRAELPVHARRRAVRALRRLRRGLRQPGTRAADPRPRHRAALRTVVRRPARPRAHARRHRGAARPVLDHLPASRRQAARARAAARPLPARVRDVAGVATHRSRGRRDRRRRVPAARARGRHRVRRRGAGARPAAGDPQRAARELQQSRRGGRQARRGAAEVDAVRGGDVHQRGLACRRG